VFITSLLCHVILYGAAQSAVQLFLNSWSYAVLGLISIIETDHLFTKQLLCLLSYAGILQRVSQPETDPLELDTAPKTAAISGCRMHRYEPVLAVDPTTLHV
jgi:hypothetical protein